MAWLQGAAANGTTVRQLASESADGAQMLLAPAIALLSSSPIKLAAASAASLLVSKAAISSGRMPAVCALLSIPSISSTERLLKRASRTLPT